MTDGSDDVRYANWVEYPHARVRVAIDTERGIPTRFVVQLKPTVDDLPKPDPLDARPVDEPGADGTAE